MLSGRDILCISSIDWDFIWQGHQEIMSRLAAQGNRVLFVENTGVRPPTLRDLPRVRSRIRNWRRGTKGFREERPNLFVFSPVVLPFPYSRMAQWVNRTVLRQALNRWMRGAGFHDPLVWTFLPTPLACSLIDDLDASLVVYYCIDDFASSSRAAHRIRRTEERLFQQADLVFVTSEKLRDRAARAASAVHLFPFGVNFEAFERVRMAEDGIPADLRELPRPIIGYVGGLHQFVDQRLVCAVADAMPQASVALVGPEQSDVSALRQRPNIHLLGPRSHAELPGYVKGFDVGIVPYRLSDYTAHVYPTKLNEYLAMGIPVVATDLHEVRQFAHRHEAVVSIAAEPDAFVDAVRRVSAEPDEASAARRIAVARGNGWTERLEAMSQLIERELARRRAHAGLREGTLRRIYRRTKQRFARGGAADPDRPRGAVDVSPAPAGRLTDGAERGGQGSYAFALLTGYGSVAIYSCSQLLLVPLYIRALGTYQFGVLMVLFGLINFGGLGAWWITGAMQRILGEYAARDDAGGFSRAFCVLRLAYYGYAVLLGLVVFAGLRAMGELWLAEAPPGTHEELLFGLELCALHFLAHYDLSTERIALTSAGRQGVANLLWGASLIGYAALVVPWLLAGGGFVGVVVCLMASTVLASIAARIYRHRTGIRASAVSRDAESRRILRRLWTLGPPYLGYGMMLLGMGADVLLVAWLGSAVMAAEYVLVWKPAEFIIQSIWRISEYSIPYLIHLDALDRHDELKRVYRVGWWSIAAVSLAAAVGYVVLAPPLVRWWVGPAAPQGYVAYALAGAAVFWLSVSRLPGVIAYSTVRLEPYLRIAAVELGGKLVLTVLLFPWVGYLAPLIGVSVMHILGVAAAYRRLAESPDGRSITWP